MEVRASRREEVPALQELFQLCFGDGPECSGAYFDHFYRPEEYLILWEGGQLLAMAGLLDVTLTGLDGRAVRGAYLYGVGTHPEHRGEGLSIRLLEYADHYLQGRRACLLTVPADEGLHRFYERFGFSEYFPLLEGGVIPRAPREGEISLPVDAAGYDKLREHLLAGRCHVSYGPLTGLQERLCGLSGGSLLSLRVNGLPGCAAVEQWGGTALCKELLIEPEGLEGALALTAQAVCAKRFLLRRPAFWPREGLSQRNFGMIKWYNTPPSGFLDLAAPPYLGLAFD